MKNEKSILRKYLKIVYFILKTNPKYDGYAIDKIINSRKLKHENSTQNIYDILMQLLKKTAKK